MEFVVGGEIFKKTVAPFCRFHAANIILHAVGQHQVRNSKSEVIHRKLVKDFLADLHRRGFAFNSHQGFPVPSVNHDVASFGELVV